MKKTTKQPKTEIIDNAKHDISPRITFIALALFMFIGLALRLYHLDTTAFWNDEALQLNGIEKTFAQLRPDHLKRAEFMPPLSYIIQRIFWLPTQTKYAARLPSVIFGLLLIPLSFLTVRRFSTRLAGLVAAFLTSTSFFLVWYSQECRTYIFWGAALWLCLYMWIII